MKQFLKKSFSYLKHILKSQRGAIITKSYTFSAGAVIVASEHNANNDLIFNDYNGNITNANLSASAGIVDTKLAQITTAGKVSGAALVLLGSIPTGAGTITQTSSVSGASFTLLGNIPSGAGVIPAVNVSLDKIMIVEDQKTAATDGGAFTQDAWRTRVLNTVQVNTITGASLASNQITLPAGTYLIEASAPARNVLRHKAKLRNVTDGTDDINGSNEYSAGGATTRSFLNKVITIAAGKVFEIQHYCEQTTAASGFGLGTGWAPEVYTQVKIEKL